MAPTSIPFDFWTKNQPHHRVPIDCLMPNGICIPLEVPSDASLLEIKEELWDEARNYPLQGLLKEQSLYNLSCINSNAENEELVDENRRLCDIKPFINLLKVVECKGDKAENWLNSQIGSLIGKGLHDFDALKSLEVNEFRWRMKNMVYNQLQDKKNVTLIQKIKYHFPCEVAETSELPLYLKPILCEDNFLVEIRFQNFETPLSFLVVHTTTPLQLIAIALQKQASLLGNYPFNPDVAQDNLLKMCGRQEYLIGDYHLSQFLCVRNCLTHGILPTFVVIPIANVPMLPENPYNEIARFDNNRSSRSSFSLTLRRKNNKGISLSSWDIEDYYSLQIDNISSLSCEESEVGIQAGIFHGGKSLCVPEKTRVQQCAGGECSWNETLTFKLAIRDIPRNARLCIVVYAVSKMAKGSKFRRVKDIEQEMYINPIAWANTTIFDYKTQLKTGPVTLYMWTYAEDVQNDEIMNPLGTVVSNPNVAHATSLTLTFSKYHAERTIIYPPMEVILDIATQLNAACPPEIGIQRLSVNGDSSGNTSLNSRGESLAYGEFLRFMAERDPMHEVHEQDKKCLWSLRYECLQQVPALLPKLLMCIEWNDYKEIAEMLSLLSRWPQLPVERALELLDFAYADSSVRSYAIGCIRHVSDEELLLYLLQLVQALKHESYLECDLVDFLISRAINNQKIGHYLFWHLRSEMHTPAVSVRFGLILEAYCRGASDHIRLLSRQIEALNKLKTISETARKSKDNREKLRAVVQEALKENHATDLLSDVLCPLDPALLCNRLRVEKCKTMDSKMKPLWVVFQNGDPFGKDIYFIFKHGDDLRQDMLTLQMIRIMDRLWKNEGHDFRMNPYGCISTGNKVGLIEVVLNADTIANIQKEKGMFSATSPFKKGSLLAWLKDHNPTESKLNKAVEQFSLSCAGYCVATYVLGIADRHSDNIMVKTNGQLFHIDFGHILGHFKEKFGIRRERVPFVLTHDFVHVITKGQTKREASLEFESFQKKCEKAFLILRRHGSFIISLFAMMISTGLPELSSEKDLDYLRETLVLDFTEQEALRHFKSKFEEALRNSWKTSVNWATHNMAKNNRQ